MPIAERPIDLENASESKAALQRGGVMALSKANVVLEINEAIAGDVLPDP
jgi:hypothetical protein